MYFTYENHNGERIDLYGDSPFILTSHNFTDWQLAFATTRNRSTGFRLDSRDFDFTVRIMPRRVKGKDRHQTFASLVNYFASVVSADIDQPGRLYAKTGEYLEGRVVVSQKTAWAVDKSVTLQCKLRVDNPIWEYPHIEHYEALSQESQNSYEFLDYPHGYNYDYSATLPGYATVNSASTEVSDYIMTIYGPVSSPLVTMNGIKVGATVTLGSGDTLVINTRDRTVLKYSGNVMTNEFNNRYKGDVSMFSQLSPGAVSMSWSGQFAFDITVLEQRREPQWMI